MRSSPPTFRLPPHWGHDVGDRLSNPPEGLVGSKTEFSVPSVASQLYIGNLKAIAQPVNSWISASLQGWRSSSSGQLAHSCSTDLDGSTSCSPSASSSSSGASSFVGIDDI